jgi:hypothetical protein
VTTFFHAPQDAAVAGAIVTHAISFFPVILAGIVFMVQDGVSMKGLGTAASAAPGPELDAVLSPPAVKELADTHEVSVLRSSR